MILKSLLSLMSLIKEALVRRVIRRNEGCEEVDLRRSGR